MANPEWAINLLERSETVLDFFKRNSLSSSASLSNLGDLLRKSFPAPGIPLPPGEMYHSLEHCIVSNFVEGCCIGGGLSVLVSVLPALLKGNIRRAAETVATTGNVRVALFFGSIMSIGNTGIYLQNRDAPAEDENHDEFTARKRSARLLIGFLSGLSVAVLPKAIRRFIIYFLLTRSLEVGARMLKSAAMHKRPDFQTEKGDVFTSHEVVGLASVSMSVIITAWFRYTHLVPKGYLQFLHGINNLTHKQVEDVQLVLQDSCAKRPDLMPIINRQVQVCSVLHPIEEPCPKFFARFLASALITRTGPFYLKLYSLPLLFSIFKRRGRISKDLILNHFAKRVWWSALFLSSLNAIVAGAVCTLQHYPSIPLYAHASIAGAASGASLYLEQDSRRLELALYLFSQAIQILVNAYEERGYWSPAGADTIFCAASIGLISYAFWEQQAQDADTSRENPLVIIRPGYVSMMSKIVDTKDCRHSFKL